MHGTANQGPRREVVETTIQENHNSIDPILGPLVRPGWPFDNVTSALSHAFREATIMRELIRGIHEGIHNANLDYETWSRGECWLNDSACEGLMVVGIARTVAEQRQGVDEKSLRLEMAFAEISANSADDGRRVDIALLDDGNPECVIEAKRDWNRTDCEDDLNRLRGLVENENVPRGVLAVFIANGAGRLDERLERAEKDIEEWRRGLNALTVNVSCGQPWDYPMDRRFSGNYQGWRATSICVDITRA